MSLIFHKMHGAANDFMLLDLRHQQTHLDSNVVKRLADRREGIGFDQLLVVGPPSSAQAIAGYEIWNTDGSRALQCGNGARCIGLFLHMNGEVPSGQFKLDSPAGPVNLRFTDDGQFEVDMGAPDFTPEAVPVTLPEAEGWYHLPYRRNELKIGAVSMGNPHALLVVENIASAAVAELGPFISSHPQFPAGCNAGFAEIVDRNTIRLRVFERGAGETLACGSGACAAMVILSRADLVNDRVNVFLPGGKLVIKWRKQDGDQTNNDGTISAKQGPFEHVLMKGPASYIFKGELNE